MSNQKRASITVYMACTLLVMISFFTSVIESARVNAMKTKLICATDLAADSVLAEYCIPMLEQYGLFFIDTAYGAGDGNYFNTASHMEEYANKNIDAFYEYEENAIVGELTDLAFREWYGITVENVSITEGYYATDQDGEVLRQQAIDYMYNYYGIDVVTDLVSEMAGNYQLFMENGWNKEENEVEQSLAENQNQIEEMQGQEYTVEVVNEEGETELETHQVDAQDPTQNLTNDKEMVLLNAILGDQAFGLSNKAINCDLYLSNRGAANEGETPSYDAGVVTDLTNELLFDRYILQKCDCFDKDKSEKTLEYEVEYILGGKSSDKENLQYVVNRILIIRELSNMASLVADSEKMSLVIGTAKALALGIPGLDLLIQGVLIAGWSYLESVQDIRDLFQGKKVPLLKSRMEWKTGLEGILGGESAVANVDKGLSYQDYLGLLLAVENEGKKTARLMDIMEMNIRKVPGYQAFRADCMIEGFQAQFCYEATGNSYTVVKKRVYDTGPIFRN